MSDSKKSLVKGDISKEVIPFDNGSRVVIEYLKDKDCELSDEFGRFTAKFRRVTLYGKLGVLSERVELNPFYDKDAAKLNDKWQKEYSLEIIHEGLSLDEIKRKVENNESYLVVIWKNGHAPLPVDLGFHKKVTLSLIDNANTVEALTFNVINIVRSMKG
ncbi:MAG: hypothetical protein E7Z75_10110 [Methanobrevibacter olleyae]|uniref:Uncharacterized protein n=1 Tax=Methanobrevibacter olleyae TaxID=294671 RepID=A0A8T3VPR6_METOL|nr:hypothetical protein [Methanosphaera stadtmanae]MBE6513474.1 hypothetical protein [Methanobrevibacter olleyae]